MSKHDADCLRRREQEGMALVCSCGMTGDQVVAARRSLSDRSACAADRVPQRVINAMVRESGRPTHDDGHTDCYYAGLFLVAFDALLEDDEAMSRLRHAYLNSPPHGPHHEHAARLAHMRAALVSALSSDEQKVAEDAREKTCGYCGGQGCEQCGWRGAVAYRETNVATEETS